MLHHHVAPIFFYLWNFTFRNYREKTMKCSFFLYNSFVKLSQFAITWFDLYGPKLSVVKNLRCILVTLFAQGVRNRLVSNFTLILKWTQLVSNFFFTNYIFYS